MIDWHTGVDKFKYYKGKLVLKNQREGKKENGWATGWQAGRVAGKDGWVDRFSFHGILHPPTLYQSNFW